MPAKPTYDELIRKVQRLEEELAGRRPGGQEEPILAAVGLGPLHLNILDRLGEGIAILDRSFQVLYQNKLHQERVGSHQGSLCYRAYHGTETVCQDCPVALTLTDGGIHRKERDLLRNGTRKFAEITSSPLLDADGRIVAVMEIVKDISDRKRMEEALRESEAMLKRIQQAAPVGIGQIGRGRVFRWVSGQVAAMLGYAPEELVGRSACILYEDEEEFQRVGRDKMAGILAAGVGETESRWRRKDGSIIEVLLRSAPLDQNDPAAALIFTALDITSRKQSERTLRDSEEKYRRLFESASDAILLADAETGFILDANPQAAELTGYPAAGLIGRHHSFIHPPAEAERYRKLFKEDGAGLTVREFNIQHRDGRLIPVEISRSDLAIGSRRVAFGIFRDLSERRRMEEELVKTQKLESLGILAGGIAHDFNNMLTAIKGNVSLATFLADPQGDLPQLLKEIDAAAEQARNLSNQLLTFAKGGEPIRKAVALPELVRETVSLALRGSNVRGEYVIDPDLRPILADAGQLGQVLHNLVINAVQAMPHGGAITVRIENAALQASDPRPLPCGNYLRITVEDQGAGILPEHLPKIFDPYFSTKRQGSGMGLTSAYSIVKRHGGLLTAESTAGRGATFTILLPAAEAEQAPPEAAKDLQAGRGRILVMDDEEHVRKIAARMIKHLGYEAVTAADGLETISLYRREIQAGRPFAAVVMDLTIPGGMGGKETLDQLLALDPGLKAVVSSGYANDPIMANFHEYGFKGVIPKPYDMITLGTVLQEVLSG